MNCKTEQVTWEIINNAYVPAVTICTKKLQSKAKNKKNKKRKNVFFKDLSIGENISVRLSPTTRINFESISAPGFVCLNESFGSNGSYFFEIYTTASYSGPITICVAISNRIAPSESRFVKLLEDGSFEDVTDSYTDSEICGSFENINFRSLDNEMTTFGPYIVISDQESRAQTYANDQFTIITSGGNSAQVVTNSDGVITEIVWGFEYEPCNPPRRIGLLNINNLFSYECDCWETVLELGTVIAIVETILTAFTIYRAIMASVSAASAGIRTLVSAVRAASDEIATFESSLKSTERLIDVLRRRLGELKRRPDYNPASPEEINDLLGQINLEMQNAIHIGDDLRDAKAAKALADASLQTAINNRNNLIQSGIASLLALQAAYRAFEELPVVSQLKECSDNIYGLNETTCECCGCEISMNFYGNIAQQGYNWVNNYINSNQTIFPKNNAEPCEFNTEAQAAMDAMIAAAKSELPQCTDNTNSNPNPCMSLVDESIPDNPGDPNTGYSGNWAYGIGQVCED